MFDEELMVIKLNTDSVSLIAGNYKTKVKLGDGVYEVEKEIIFTSECPYFFTEAEVEEVEEVKKREAPDPP